MEIFEQDLERITKEYTLKKLFLPKLISNDNKHKKVVKWILICGSIIGYINTLENVLILRLSEDSTK